MKYSGYIGKVRYVGESFYKGDGLTNGKVYDCIGMEPPFLRIIDDNYQDIPYDIPGYEYTPGYLYSAKEPMPPNGENAGGRWDVVEDDEKGSLTSIVYG